MIQDFFEFFGNNQIRSIAGGAGTTVTRFLGHMQVLDKVQSTRFDRRPELFKGCPDLTLDFEANYGIPVYSYRSIESVCTYYEYTTLLITITVYTYCSFTVLRSTRITCVEYIIGMYVLRT